MTGHTINHQWEQQTEGAFKGYWICAHCRYTSRTRRKPRSGGCTGPTYPPEDLKQWSWAFSLLFWVIFVTFASWYAINFDYFAEIHDIDDATNTAVNSVSDGINPYEEYVVPRFKDKLYDCAWCTVGIWLVLQLISA